MQPPRECPDEKNTCHYFSLNILTSAETVQDFPLAYTKGRNLEIFTEIKKNLQKIHQYSQI